MNIDEYRDNPYSLSALPYWKSISFKIPSNMSVVHKDEYLDDLDSLSLYTLYFRPKNNLKSIEEVWLN